MNAQAGNGKSAMDLAFDYAQFALLAGYYGCGGTEYWRAFMEKLVAAGANVDVKGRFEVGARECERA